MKTKEFEKLNNNFKMKLFALYYFRPHWKENSRSILIYFSQHNTLYLIFYPRANKTGC